MNEEKLKLIYDFLNKNREFNKRVQSKYYSSILSHKNKSEKVISLLYHVVNSQSQLNIDHWFKFQKSIQDDLGCVKSFADFVKKLCGKGSNLYIDLFSGLKSQDGWGEKTSALFVKSVYHTHNGNYDKSFRFWDDAPRAIDREDELKLPVDKVISHIFNEIGLSDTFKGINKILCEHFSGKKIEVWDDLWFWGFITQKGSKDRSIEWNESKYWSLEHTNKNESEINKIRSKADDFIKLLDLVKIKI